MDTIKNQIDKLFDQLNSDSLAYNLPKRQSLNFTDGAMATSSPNQLSKKRKLSEALHTSAVSSTNDTTAATANRSAISMPDDSRHDNTSRSLNTTSLLNASSASQLSVPFEIRRLRADVLDYSTRATQMKNELENRTVVHQRMEQLYKSKVASLEKQLECSEAKLRDSDKHLKLVRRREKDSQAAAVKAQHALAEQRCAHEEAIAQLLRARHEADAKVREAFSDLEQQLDASQRRCDELERNAGYQSAEIESLQERCERLQERQRNHSKLEANEALMLTQLDGMQRRVAELENELAAHGEWKELSRTFQQRVARVPDLEQEVERLRREKAAIYDTIGNKLLLEEEVHDLRGRLERAERNRADAAALRQAVQLAEAELADYRAVARDHCAAEATAGTAAAAATAGQLRHRIEELLRNDLLLASEKGEQRAEKESAVQRVDQLLKEVEVQRKATENLQTSLKYHKTSMHRVQKKLQLVARERDCYKHLIDNYEKDLTISGPGPSEVQPDAQLRIKLELVERMVDEYKELCSGLEAELQGAKNMPDLGVDPVNGEHYEQFKRDIVVLRQENEQLQRRKNELELMLEHSSLKGAYDVERFKVVHMQASPLAEAAEAHAEELVKLRAEIERLKRRNKKVEEEHAEMTVRMNETVNITSDVREVILWNKLLVSMVSLFQTASLLSAGRFDARADPVAGSEEQAPEGIVPSGQPGVPRGVLHAVRLPGGPDWRQQLSVGSDPRDAVTLAKQC